MVYIPKKGEIVKHYKDCPCSGCKFGITKPILLRAAPQSNKLGKEDEK